MPIYLRHSIHGTKVAISEQEASYDETNGWNRFTYDIINDVEAIKPVKKPGRPKTSDALLKDIGVIS